jgi:hypothetical protein
MCGESPEREAFAMSDHCRHCGGRGSQTGYTAGFVAGMQHAAFETYYPNIDIAARNARDETEATLRAVQHALDSRG